MENLRTALQGKKTYFIAAIGALYLLGVWSGVFPYDEKVISALGLGGVATLAAKINRNSTPLLLLCGALALTGCAGFGTRQQDLRYDPDTGKLTGKITTHASSYTLFSSRSDLTKWKATQSEKTQGAEVGGLSQQGGTNSAATLQALAELLKAVQTLK